jgi:ABC-2 type transport system permease protein
MTTFKPATPTAAVAPVLAPRSTGRLSFGRVVRSEWIKLSTLRSNWVTAIILFVELVGMPLLLVYAVLTVRNSAQGAGQAIQIGVGDLAGGGQSFGLLIAAVLGILSIGGEFSTGSIRTSLVAVPRRGMLLGAKSLVVALFVGAISLVGVIVGVFGGVLLADAGGITIDPTADDGLAKAGLAVLSIMLFAVFAFGVGLLVHSTAGAITIVVAVVFILPLVLQILDSLLRSEWLAQTMNYLPSSLASGMVTWPTDPSQPAWWVSTLVLAAWAFVPLVVGIVIFQGGGRAARTGAARRLDPSQPAA